MTHVTLSLLGTPQILKDGQTVEFRTRKAIALLAYLAMHPGRRSRDELALLLWPDYAKSRAALRNTLYEINKKLGKEWLKTDRQHIELLQPRGLRIDVVEFQTLIAACRSHGHSEDDVCPACVPELADAAELYRGPFLAGFSLDDSLNFDEWQLVEAESLQLQMSAVLERLVRGLEMTTDMERAILFARRWLALDDCHEPAQRKLMTLFALNGQREAALRQYEKCVQLLDSELGLPPQPETVRLYERIRENELAGMSKLRQVRERGSLAELIYEPGGGLHNFPLESRNFVGREDEQTQVLELLSRAECRLITLVGLGGIGKTRLAAETVRRLADADSEFEQGFYFVPLAPVSSADYLVSAMADALDFSFYGQVDPAEQLLNFLRHKQMLLVLDNFEHMLAGAEFVARILQEAPGLKIIVTSRERLQLHDEWVIALSGLPYPAENEPVDMQSVTDYPAVRLFVQGARRVFQDFQLGDEETTCLVNICRLVEGMPLALELASSWVRAISCREIAGEIERDMEFLVTTMRQVPDRHRSMEAVFNYSWRNLTAEEQLVIQRLSVFRGGCTREAAEQVAGANLPLLVSLVDKSLLQRSGIGRYELHELLRQYAAKKLAADSEQLEEAEAEHGRYFIRWLQQQEVRLKGPQQVEATEQVAAEGENIRFCWLRSAEKRETSSLSQILEPMAIFAETRGLFEEVLQLLQFAIDNLTDIDEHEAIHLTARLFAWQGLFLIYLVRYEEAENVLNRAVKLGQQIDRALVWARAGHYLGLLHGRQGRYEEAEQLQRRSLAVFQAEESSLDEAAVYHELGRIYFSQSLYDQARRAAETGLEIRRKVGMLSEITKSLVGLGVIVSDLNEHDLAIELFEESRLISQSLGYRRMHSLTLTNLGNLQKSTGNLILASDFLNQSLKIKMDLGDALGIAHTRTKLAELAAFQGDYVEARVNFLDCLRIRRQLDDLYGIGHVLNSLGDLALIENDLNQAESYYEQAKEISVSVNMQLNLAYSQYNLGRIENCRNRYLEANKILSRSLAICERVNHLPGVMLCLAQLSYSAWKLNQAIRAKDLLSRALLTGKGLKVLSTAI